MVKAAIYTGTRNLYRHMIPAVKSLLFNSDVDVVYLGIEDHEFPYELPDVCEVMDLSGQEIFSRTGPNFKSRYTYMALMRAALVKILPPELPRVLSLDVDTIVVDDISDIWDLPIDDYYFAAAREWHASTDRFINANVGVSLHNLEKLRDGKSEEIIRMLNKRQFRWCEQDAMNLLCQGYIYNMPAEYNDNCFTDKVDRTKIIHYLCPNDELPTKPDVQRYAAMSFDEVMAKRGGK